MLPLADALCSDALRSGVTDAGFATLVSAINNGALLPKLRNLSLEHNYDASDEAQREVKEALEARGLVVHR